jgi:hypothetical protein
MNGLNDIMYPELPPWMAMQWQIFTQMYSSIVLCNWLEDPAIVPWSDRLPSFTSRLQQCTHMHQASVCVEACCQPPNLKQERGPRKKPNNDMMPSHSRMTTGLQLKFFLPVVAVFENDKESGVLSIAGDMQS